ncbi:MAG: translation initiation factor IF-2 [Xenococcaceae cyanobacterium MO_188.B19]|nr:translation initiation factor IF-2 [Xenococcaceae cyanobacterium MO_188.B19]MDJ0680643.1 translation initiation factor IF-2 [Xenococcaceae cyanobacterium MO_167.B52]
MGFADLSILDIATQYDLEVETLFRLCDRLNISYKNEATCLALEDAKMVILEILSANTPKDEESELNQDQKGLTK